MFYFLFIVTFGGLAQYRTNKLITNAIRSYIYFSSRFELVRISWNSTEVLLKDFLSILLVFSLLVLFFVGLQIKKYNKLISDP